MLEKDKESKCVDFCQVSIMDDFSLTCCILTIFNVASGIDAFVDIMSPGITLLCAVGYMQATPFENRYRFQILGWAAVKK